MTVTGCILVDLTAVREDRQRQRIAAALGDAPEGAAVEVIVGALRPLPDGVVFLRRYADERRLLVTVKGECFAVKSWIESLRTGELCGMLL